MRGSLAAVCVRASAGARERRKNSFPRTVYLVLVPVRASPKERKRTPQGRDGRTARRHHTGILRRGVWCASRRPPLGVRLFLSHFAVSLRFSLQPSCHLAVSPFSSCSPLSPLPLGGELAARGQGKLLSFLLLPIQTFKPNRGVQVAVLATCGRRPPRNVARRRTLMLSHPRYPKS